VLLRIVTLLVLCLATPGVADVAQELLSHATGVECCDDGGCDDGTGQCDPTECMHCVGCSHGMTLATVITTSAVLSPLSNGHVHAVSTAQPCASGFHTTPFRPPAS
jgi:hypothetical protein